MTLQFEIPDHLKEAYRRVIAKAPEKLREDSRFQNLTLLHLKVGGERLAGQNTELYKLMLEEERIFNRWLIREDEREGVEPSELDGLSDEDASPDREEEEGRVGDPLDGEGEYDDPEDADEDEFSEDPDRRASAPPG